MMSLSARFRNLRAAHGFTLPEIIIVVAVIAILTSLSAPPLFQLMRQRDTQQEENRQIEIQKAMRAYLSSTKQLPTDVIAASVTDPDNWFNALARFSNLSARQLRFDVWGNERRYVRLQRNELLLGSTIPIYYATVISAGVNQAPDATTGLPSGGGAFTYNATAGGNLGGFAASTDTAWWKAQTDPVTAFGNLSAGSDDQLIRFTDYADKITRYGASLERLSKVTDALESYAKAKYADAVAAGEANAENQLYYPMSYSSEANGAAADGATYNWRPTNEISSANAGATYVNGYSYVFNGAENNTRYEAMRNLMRILGLPDDHCCNALSTFTDASGNQREMPFYYASNPRARNSGGGCAARPNPGAGQSTLPARISTMSVTATGSCY